MSVSVRLSRVGKKNFPVYRVVVMETRSKRNGKNLAVLGIYNPQTNPPTFNIRQKDLEDWIKKGAIISAGLKKLLKK